MQNDPSLRRLFEQCVEQNSASMYRVAYRLSGCRASAEELVQEAFLHAWQGLPKLKDRTKIRGWLFSIMRRRFSKTNQSMNQTQPLSPPRLDDLASPSSPTRDPREEMLQQAIDRLDDEHRFPLLLVAMEGMGTDEAAEILDIPRGTVLSRVHRAKEKIRAMLECQSEFDNTVVRVTASSGDTASPPQSSGAEDKRRKS